MTSVPQVRGALLEEAVIHLLRSVGYDLIEVRGGSSSEEQGIRDGRSGLEVRGRGAWHQIDALAQAKHSPAFVYPMRLMVEAKCYRPGTKVGIEIARNAVGVLRDISENYFTVKLAGRKIQSPRFNLVAAIFSASGFTRGAVEYSVAHQLFLIQYSNVPVIRPLVDAILRFDESCLSKSGREAVSAARQYLRRKLRGTSPRTEDNEHLTQTGIELLDGAIAANCSRIKGSYFGMLQGRWPIHLLREEPLPESSFDRDEVLCRVSGNRQGEWGFEPVSRERGQEGWFRLEFSLPTAVTTLASQVWDDPIAVADIKQQHFSYIDLSGSIGAVRRNVRLRLDRDWIREYVRSTLGR